MREMNGASIQTRMNALQDGPLTGEGSAAPDELRITLSRAARADSGQVPTGLYDG
jgi:hypothetical protein